MKKIFCLIGLTLILSGVLNAQTLGGKMWQLQNPQILAYSEILNFESGGAVHVSMLNLDTQQTAKMSGTWKRNGAVLSVSWENGAAASYQVAFYYGGLVFTAKDNKTGTTGNYAVTGSAYDTYFSRFMASRGMSAPAGGGYNSGGGSYTPPVKKAETCYTCQGLKTCRLCKGSGRTSSMYGHGGGELCTGCGGTGKCWHCYGSGKQ